MMLNPSQSQSLVHFYGLSYHAAIYLLSISITVYPWPISGNFLFNKYRIISTVYALELVGSKIYYYLFRLFRFTRRYRYLVYFQVVKLKWKFKGGDEIRITSQVE